MDTYYPDTLYLYVQGCEAPWLFFETKRRPPVKMFGKTRSKILVIHSPEVGRVA